MAMVKKVRRLDLFKSDDLARLEKARAEDISFGLIYFTKGAPDGSIAPSGRGGA